MPHENTGVITLIKLNTHTYYLKKYLHKQPCGNNGIFTRIMPREDALNTRHHYIYTFYVIMFIILVEVIFHLYFIVHYIYK